MSGPASKLFPPGFFPAENNNSIDSKHSPMKISIDESGNTYERHHQSFNMNQNPKSKRI